MQQQQQQQGKNRRGAGSSMLRCANLLTNTPSSVCKGYMLLQLCTAVYCTASRQYACTAAKAVHLYYCKGSTLVLL